MKKVLILILCTAFLSGCGTGTIQAEKITQDITPNIVETGSDSLGYSYIVDKNTGVVYLSYDGYNRRGVSVMLNADGTPITAQQLGIEYQH